MSEYGRHGTSDRKESDSHVDDVEREDGCESSAKEDRKRNDFLLVRLGRVGGLFVDSELVPEPDDGELFRERDDAGKGGNGG